MSSNFILLVASIITGLLVPKILGTNNYGYYRMFVLYTTYTALLHFGYVDGILLNDGGKHYNDLNLYRYRTNSLIFIFSQLIIALLFIIASFFISEKIWSILILTIGIGTFLENITTYYRYVSQAVLRFKEFSIRNTIQAELIILVTLLLWIGHKLNISIFSNATIYIWLMLLVYLIIFIIYIVSYKDITIGPHDSFILGFHRVIRYCKLGIYLTIAYQISNLIMIIDNQIVSMFFKVSTYGEYSFSYSITGTVMAILSAVGTVLLPHLKRDNFHHIIKIYHTMISIMMLVVYLALLGYFPLCLLVHIILPEYTPALSYLKIFLPELGVTCSLSIITFNYYNVLGKSKFYFYISSIIVILSAIIDAFMYISFHNPFLVALGSFISIIIWYIISEYFLVKWYHIQWCKNSIYMIMMISLFFLTCDIHNLIIGFLIYLIFYMAISYLMFHILIKKYIDKIKPVL